MVQFGEVVRRLGLLLGVDDDDDDDGWSDEVASPQWGETDVQLV